MIKAYESHPGASKEPTMIQDGGRNATESQQEAKVVSGTGKLALSRPARKHRFVF